MHKSVVRRRNLQYLIANHPFRCWFGRAMRRLFLPCTCIVLLAATFVLWQYRFERDSEHPTLRLADLKTTSTLVPEAFWVETKEGPAILLRTSETTAAIVQRIALPNLAAAHWLHLRFQIQAKQLRLGKFPWSDGRLILEWHSSEKSWEFDPVSSVRDDQDSGIIDVIARPDNGSASPALRTENLARAGEFQLCLFEASVVRERSFWRVGRWGLFLGWSLWFLCAAGFAARRSRLRSALAAAIWIAMAILFVFPGPWKTLHPLGSAFQIGPELRQSQPSPAPAPAAALPPSQAGPLTSAPLAATPTPPPPPKIEPPPSAGRVATQGSLILRLKNQMSQLPPLLCSLLRSCIHIFLLFAPTLASVLLVGRKRAILLACLIALAIEAAQFLFGYGLDGFDLLDLLFDACGILLALWVYRKIGR